MLDLMSSWTSHLPPDVKVERLVGVGLNEVELQANPLLTEYRVLDLQEEVCLLLRTSALHNQLHLILVVVQAALPFEENSFDLVLCSVSIDYLIRPLQVLEEVHRVLKPGGTSVTRLAFFWAWRGRTNAAPTTHVLTASATDASPRRGSISGCIPTTFSTSTSWAPTSISRLGSALRRRLTSLPARG